MCDAFIWLYEAVLCLTGQSTCWHWSWGKEIFLREWNWWRVGSREEEAFGQWRKEHGRYFVYFIVFSSSEMEVAFPEDESCSRVGLPRLINPQVPCVWEDVKCWGAQDSMPEGTKPRTPHYQVPGGERYRKEADQSSVKRCEKPPSVRPMLESFCWEACRFSVKRC